MYWVRDEPSRLAADKDAEQVILERTRERIAECWRLMDALVPRGTAYLLGDRVGVLDIYVAVVSRWTPGRTRFDREAPRMAEVVRRVDADPRLADFWAARFPFKPGWEGPDASRSSRDGKVRRRPERGGQSPDGQRNSLRHHLPQPACGTSRNTLALIREQGIEPQVVEYLKTPPTKAKRRSALGELIHAEAGTSDSRRTRRTLNALTISTPCTTARPISTLVYWPWSISRPKISGATACPMSSPA
jgi:arsenate reductase-like glutaredoxin family protein